MHPNIAKILVTEEEIRDRVAVLGREITNDYRGKKLLLVGILKGSAVFMADLMRQIDLDVQIDFMVVSSYSNSTQSQGHIQIRKDLSTDINGRDVLVVEDMIDSGTTLYYLNEILQVRGAHSVEFVTLLNKPSRREKQVDVRYIGFDVPNEFVVGYGIDFAENYRNLPFVGVLHPECYES